MGKPMLPPESTLRHTHTTADLVTTDTTPLGVYQSDRPIIFSAPMIHAIQDGRKSQTRRVVRLCDCGWENSLLTYWDNATQRLMLPCGHLKRPIYQPGQGLWIRETFQLARNEQKEPIVVYAADGIELPQWKSPIFMNRQYSRIDLEITSVRVERLLDISEEDAKAEGMVPYSRPANQGGLSENGYHETYKRAFLKGWDKIHNGTKINNAHLLNPWVYAIAFKRSA